MAFFLLLRRSNNNHHIYMFLEMRKTVYTRLQAPQFKHLLETLLHMRQAKQNMSSSPTETCFITNFFYQRYFKAVDENSGEYVLRKTM